MSLENNLRKVSFSYYVFLLYKQISESYFIALHPCLQYDRYRQPYDPKNNLIRCRQKHAHSSPDKKYFLVDFGETRQCEILMTL